MIIEHPPKKIEPSDMKFFLNYKAKIIFLSTACTKNNFIPAQKKMSIASDGQSLSS